LEEVGCHLQEGIPSCNSGADDIENTASSIVAFWTVFTELLPGNTLIKSVRIYIVQFALWLYEQVLKSERVFSL
jgi:hypothetical protein